MEPGNNYAVDYDLSPISDRIFFMQKDFLENLNRLSSDYVPPSCKGMPAHEIKVCKLDNGCGFISPSVGDKCVVWKRLHLQYKGLHSFLELEKGANSQNKDCESSILAPNPGVDYSRKSTKCIREKRVSIQMVVGIDIFIEEVTNFVGKTLVGRFCGISIGDEALSKWIASHWEPKLGYTPVMHTLAEDRTISFCEVKKIVKCC
jgi:hypothetical protein